MKTIEITDEMYDSLMEISKELNTQNHRSTAMPYFFQIQDETEAIVYEDNGGEIKYIHDGDIIE